MSNFHCTVSIGSVLLNEVKLTLTDSSNEATFFITPAEAVDLAKDLANIAMVVQRAHNASTCTNCGDA